MTPRQHSEVWQRVGNTLKEQADAMPVEHFESKLTMAVLANFATTLALEYIRQAEIETRG